MGPVGSGAVLAWIKSRPAGAAGVAGGGAGTSGGGGPGLGTVGAVNLTGCGFGVEGAEQLLVGAGGPAVAMKRACLADNMFGQQVRTRRRDPGAESCHALPPHVLPYIIPE